VAWSPSDWATRPMACANRATAGETSILCIDCLLIGTFPPALQLVEAYTYSFPKRALVSCIRCFGQEDR